MQTYSRYEVKKHGGYYHVDEYTKPGQSWCYSRSVGSRSTLRGAKRLIRKDRERKLKPDVLYSETNGVTDLPDVRMVAIVEWEM